MVLCFDTRGMYGTGDLLMKLVIPMSLACKGIRNDCRMKSGAVFHWKRIKKVVHGALGSCFYDT